MKIIKREILIEAPISKVWKHITDPEKIAGWLMPNDFRGEGWQEIFYRLPAQRKTLVRCEGDHS